MKKKNYKKIKQLIYKRKVKQNLLLVFLSKVNLLNCLERKMGKNFISLWRRFNRKFNLFFIGEKLKRGDKVGKVFLLPIEGIEK